MGWRRVGIGTALAACLCAAPVTAAELVWPLDVDPILTSSFGEPRPTHLHAGIDLGTGGRTGLRCRAVGDGWVARMRMSPFGYGKALYLQLDTGEIVVYAHLDRFAEPMAERAWSEQKKRGRYSFDITLRRGEIPVRRGQVVAWSGDTGVGFPHLHFEMRQGDSPINPQTSGFPVPDRVRPTIRDISVMPLDSGSHADGDALRHTMKIAGGASTLDPVIAGGRLGFAVNCIDRAARGPYRQAPYRYTLRVDGRTLYEAHHERFDYAHNHHIVLDYDQERLVRFNAKSFLLYARPGNRLPGRKPASGTRGMLLAAVREAAGLDDGAVVGPGRHEVEIEVADVAGGTRSVRFPLIVSHPPAIDVLDVDGSGLVECEASDPEGEALELELHVSRDAGASWQALPTERAGEEPRWSARLPSGAGPGTALRARVRDASGLSALQTWVTPPDVHPNDALALDVATRWEYGRLRVELTTDALLAQTPTLWLQRPDARRRALDGVVQRGERLWVWVGDVADLEDSDALVVGAVDHAGRRRILQHPTAARIVRRGTARIVDDLHPRLQIEFEPGTLLEDVALRARPCDTANWKLGPELEPAGLCIAVEPGAAALDKRVRVHVRAPTTVTATNGDGAPAEHVGLFVRNRRGLRFLTAEVDAAGDLVGSTRFLGTFVLLRDTTPPTLRDFVARTSPGKPPRLRFVVHDRGADLADGALDVDIDGVRAIPEWDPETGRVRVHPTRALTSGAHRMTVAAVDRLGNRSTRTWTFEVP